MHIILKDHRHKANEKCVILFSILTFFLSFSIEIWDKNRFNISFQNKTDDNSKLPSNREITQFHAQWLYAIKLYCQILFLLKRHNVIYPEKKRLLLVRMHSSISHLLCSSYILYIFWILFQVWYDWERFYSFCTLAHKIVGILQSNLLLFLPFC